MERLAMMLKAVARRSAYVLVNVLIFFFAFLFIFKGYHHGDTGQRDALYLSIGSSLIAAGIVTVVDLWKELWRSKLLEKVSNIVFDAGIEHVYFKRDLDRYDDLMNKLSDRLDITGYTLNAFYESYADLLVEKLNTQPSLNVRILIVNPESDFARNRAKLEGKLRVSFRDSVERLKSRFASFDNVKLRQLDSPLSTMIFRIDNVMFAGPHFHKKPSKSTLTLELNHAGRLFDEYDKEFTRLWDSSIAV
jgi:hypothetical protein